MENIINNGSTHTATMIIKKIGHRKFQAGIKYAGKAYSAEGGQKRKAISSLEEILKDNGIPIPNWSLKVVDNTVEEKGPDTVRSAPPVEVAAVEVAAMPKLDQGGVVTPFTDKEAWVKEFHASLGAISITGAENKDFSEGVNALMELHGYIGAFRRLPNGDTWLSYAGIRNPMVKPVKAGSGQANVVDVSEKAPVDFSAFGEVKAPEVESKPVAKASEKATESKKGRKSPKDPRDEIYFTNSQEIRNFVYNYANGISRKAWCNVMDRFAREHGYADRFDLRKKDPTAYGKLSKVASKETSPQYKIAVCVGVAAVDGIHRPSFVDFAADHGVSMEDIQKYAAKLVEKKGGEISDLKRNAGSTEAAKSEKAVDFSLFE